MKVDELKRLLDQWPDDSEVNVATHDDNDVQWREALGCDPPVDEDDTLCIISVGEIVMA